MVMGDEYLGKTFKSGNSVALRVLKGLDAPENTEVRLDRKAPMSFRVEPIVASRKTIDVSGFAGKMPGFKPAPLEDVLEAFVRAIPIIAFVDVAAREYARLPFRRAGFDRLLAAHALSIAATVLTNNEANYADAPGLKVENWTT
jgi:tRNA(fMet)-specific endonuclease VapC